MSRIKTLLISFISLIPLAIYGATQGADGIVTETITSPLGGLNTADPSFKMNPKFSPYMRNVFIDDGKIEGIKGYTVLGSSMVLSRVTGIFPFKRESGQTTFLVTDSSITLETADFKAWTFVSSGSNTGSLLNWMQVRNKMWGFNGVDFVMTWDGTSRATLGGNPAVVPSVPKFRYGAYWHDRVWGLSIPGFASDVYYSALSSTDGAIINPDDYRAWPATQFLKVNSGNGENGTALWVSNGQLNVGKERSIYTIFGTNPSNYFVRENESDAIGIVSNDSVVNHDGQTYFLSRNGIYKDGTRISDLIEPDIESIAKTNVNVVSNLWETQSEFSKGQFSGTTVTAVGVLSLYPSSHTVNFDALPSLGSYSNPGEFLEFSSTQSQFTQFMPLISTGTGHPEFKGKVQTVAINARGCTTGFGGCGGVFSATLRIRNSRTGGLAEINGNGNENFDFSNLNGGSAIEFTEDDITSGKMMISISTRNDVAADNFYQIYTTTTQGYAQIYMQPSIYGQFISDIATETSVTAWGNFNSFNQTHGQQGTINYFIRSSTSIVNIATKTWGGISPGATIGEPIINNYIQWATTIAYLAPFTPGVSPEIDNVTIDHVEGGSAFDRAFGISYKNRYWLATTTAVNSGKTLIYVKSKITNENPDAWMPIEGINIYSFAKDGDNLYGGSISTGIIYRLDYGTNFDGMAIRYVYDTPSLILGDNYRSKSIMSYLLDADRDSGSNLSIGTSIDEGDFSWRTLSLNGSGRGLFNIKGVTNPAKTLRVRFEQTQLDKLFGINDITIRAKLGDIIEPKP